MISRMTTLQAAILTLTSLVVVTTVVAGDPKTL